MYTTTFEGLSVRFYYKNNGLMYCTPGHSGREYLVRDCLPQIQRLAAQAARHLSTKPVASLSASRQAIV